MQILEESMIGKLLSAVPKIYGQKALQKLVYLYQEIGGLPVQEYDFMWSHYGPYSVELAKDAEFLVSTGDISISGRVNVIEATTALRPKLTKNEKSALSELVRLKGGLQPSQLELLASIQYAVRRGGLPKGPDSIFGYIDRVKPGKFDRQEFDRMWRLLEESGLI